MHHRNFLRTHGGKTDHSSGCYHRSALSTGNHVSLGAVWPLAICLLDIFQRNIQILWIKPLMVSRSSEYETGWHGIAPTPSTKCVNWKLRISWLSSPTQRFLRCINALTWFLRSPLLWWVEVIPSDIPNCMSLHFSHEASGVAIVCYDCGQRIGKPKHMIWLLSWGRASLKRDALKSGCRRFHWIGR